MRTTVQFKRKAKGVRTLEVLVGTVGWMLGIG